MTIKKLIRVRRDRHNWKAGHFQTMIGQRIPFPDRGAFPGDPLMGRLESVEETEKWISLQFDDVAYEPMG